MATVQPDTPTAGQVGSPRGRGPLQAHGLSSVRGQGGLGVKLKKAWTWVLSPGVLGRPWALVGSIWQPWMGEPQSCTCGDLPVPSPQPLGGRVSQWWPEGAGSRAASALLVALRAGGNCALLGAALCSLRLCAPEPSSMEAFLWTPCHCQVPGPALLN